MVSVCFKRNEPNHNGRCGTSDSGSKFLRLLAVDGRSEGDQWHVARKMRISTGNAKQEMVVDRSWNSRVASVCAGAVQMDVAGIWRVQISRLLRLDQPRIPMTNWWNLPFLVFGWLVRIVAGS